MLLLLHGYGSNEEDLVGLAPHLNPKLISVGARAPYELPFGGFAWFNIEWAEEGIRFDYDQARESVQPSRCVSRRNKARSRPFRYCYSRL